MGYMGLDHPVNSDDAASYISNIIDSIIKESKKELKNPGNDYNTNGTENVAMFLYHFICPNYKEWEPFLDDDFIQLVDKTIKKLRLLIKSIKKITDGEREKESYYMHLNHYKKWLKRITIMRETL